jgi:hypothetical protein
VSWLALPGRDIDIAASGEISLSRSQAHSNSAAACHPDEKYLVDLARRLSWTRFGPFCRRM